MKKVLFFCVLVVLALCMAACGGAPTNEENNEQIVENQENNNQENNTEDVSNEEVVTIETLGTVYVGIDGAYPPYCFLNENDEVDGFEVAIMNEIAARNDIEIVCQITSWTSMFGQLDSGRIDTVAEAISKTPEREETYIFSKSYVENSNRFLVRGGEESSIESFEDLEGKKLVLPVARLLMMNCWRFRKSITSALRSFLMKLLPTAMTCPLGGLTPRI